MMDATYTLSSTPAVYAPGIIKYAQHLFKCGSEEQAIKIVQSWQVPEAIARLIVSPSSEYPLNVDEVAETVSITVPEHLSNQVEAA